MPTNDERRAAANTIRRYNGQANWTYLVKYAACRGDMDAGESAFLNRLADLIEPDRDLTCEWVSVDDRLPDCKGEYIVAYHPCCWDNVKYDKVLVGMDSFTGKSSWYRRKYQRVTHWMPKPEPPRAKVVAE